MNVSLFSQKNNCEKLADLESRITRLTQATSFNSITTSLLKNASAVAGKVFGTKTETSERPPDPPENPSLFNRLFKTTFNSPNVLNTTNPKTGGNKSMKYRKNRNKKTRRRRN
jgi:hypothetical protein